MKNETAVLETILALLRQHTKLHHFSLIMFFVSLVLLLSPVLDVSLPVGSFSLLLLAMFFAVAQIITSVRLGFDCELLENLRCNQQYPSQRLKCLDYALIKLALIPANKAGRTLDQRLAACKKLFARQIVLCLLQFIMLLLAALLVYSGVSYVAVS